MDFCFSEERILELLLCNSLVHLVQPVLKQAYEAEEADLGSAKRENG